MCGHSSVAAPLEREAIVITGVVLARNEEAQIEACLDSFRPWVAELLLIDMESEDATVERARPFVNRILTAPLVPNFDASRNLAIPVARHDWLWFLDADERVSPQLGRLVNELVRDAPFDALYVPFKSHFAGKWMEHCGWWPGYTMPRVLRRGCFQFRTELHGGVDVRGRTQFLPADPAMAIEHFSYRDVEHYIEKFNRYTTTEAKQLSEVPFRWDEGVRAMVRDLWLYYERNQGHRDGQHGWILSWLAGQYRWFSHAKLLDIQGPTGSIPESLDAVLDCMHDELSRMRRETPRLPLGIVFRSPLFDPSGYADDGRFVLSAIARGTRPVQGQEHRWSQATCEIRDAPLLRALTRCRRPDSTATITNCIPSLAPPPDPAASLNILRATFETDRIPAEWLPKLDAYDEIWVYSPANLEPFRRGGAAPERLRAVESGVDCDLFTARGAKFQLPNALRDRFVFLSIFDWQLRKGWDVLLAAYCEEFSASDGVGLLLKITRAHGHTFDQIQDQANSVLARQGTRLHQRPGIVLIDSMLSQAELASLYRSVDTFVLPSRGEGWGRPYLEAMATGLPTIGSKSGNSAFMNEDNSYLVDARWTAVSEEAAREIPVYAGHRWLEPTKSSLRSHMRSVVADPKAARAVGRRAAKYVRMHFSPDAAAYRFEEALAAAEQRFVIPALPEPSGTKVVLEGEFFANHSFSNVNEQIALGLRDKVALSLDRVRYNPTHDEKSPAGPSLRPYFNRFSNGDITIRHAFPPRFESRPPGRWVHIQPWEFGALPLDWVEPLKSADEVWAPSQYVKRVYAQSGIDNVVVIPWGVNPEVYKPSVPPLCLPDAEFRFLFVGGTILRKGFDLVFAAYLSEFADDEGVSLVVKDIGTKTFYRYGNLREQILEHVASGRRPHIAYMERDMTDGQRASLYAACDCLVAPYRGEGFGLPILEAMACGLVPIVPQGGASDDFVDDSTAYLIPASEVECEHDWRLCGVPTELRIDLTDLRSAMREAYRNRAQTRRMGARASKYVHGTFTWDHTVSAMATRLDALARQPVSQAPIARSPATLTVCMIAENDERTIGASLGRLRPFADEIIVLSTGKDRAGTVASEYGCRVYPGDNRDYAASRNAILKRATSQWILSLDADEWMDEQGLARVRELIATTSAEALRVRVDGMPQIRVFQNRNGLEFSGPACEQIAPSIRGEILDTDIEVVRPNKRPAKPQIVARLSEAIGNGRDPWMMYNLGIQQSRLGNPFHAECFFADSGNVAAQVGSLLEIGSDYQAEDIAKRSLGASAGEVAVHIDRREANQLRVYLGAGTKRLAGYLHVDIAGDVDVIHDLNELPWPWENDTVDIIVAEDVVEHLDIDLLRFCDEAWRVLTPEGQLFVRTPHHTGDSSWIDPTHRWHLNEQAFHYLDPDTQWGQLYPQYTERKWRILSLGIRGPQNIHAVLMPRKPVSDGSGAGQLSSRGDS